MVLKLFSQTFQCGWFRNSVANLYTPRYKESDRKGIEKEKWKFAGIKTKQNRSSSLHLQ